MTNKETTIIIYGCNLLGLLFDIGGVLILFYLRESGLTNMNIYMEDSEVRSSLISNIRRTNDGNTSIRRKSEKLIWLIILGFLLQAIATVMGFFHNY